MKRSIKLSLLLAAIIFAVSAGKAQAQAAKPIHQKDMISHNPTADADIKTVTDFTNWLVSGDIDKARSLMADSYKAYGPSPADSTTADQEVAHWKDNYKTQTDRKVGFVAETFRVLSGDLKGNWVSVWGDYTFTSIGKTVKFPYQCTFHVTNGKIDNSRIYYDRSYIYQQLGYTLVAPTGSR
jgi:ketosteroid isomerase-like protein